MTARRESEMESARSVEMTHHTDAEMKGRPMTRGLGRRLLMWFLLLSLIPLFGSNAIGYLRTRLIIEGLVDRYLGGVTDLQARGIEDGVERHFSYLEQVANDDRVFPGADPGLVRAYLSLRVPILDDAGQAAAHLVGQIPLRFAGALFDIPEHRRRKHRVLHSGRRWATTLRVSLPRSGHVL